MSRLLLPLFACLLCVCFVQLSDAGIQNVSIENDDREIIFFGTFGFTKRGYVDLSVSNISFSNVMTDDKRPFNGSRAAFLATPVYGPPFECLLDDPHSITITTFDERALAAKDSLKPTTTTIPVNENRDILFVNCNWGTQVSMQINLKTFNVDENGEKSFIPIGEVPLPTLFFSFSLVYVIMTIFWIAYCLKRKQYCHRIHIVMGILLPIKAVNLLFAAEDKYHVMLTGEERGWGVLFFISQLIRAILLSTVIILIGAGWSYLKPVLQLKEKLVLAAGIILQTIVNIGYLLIQYNMVFESFFDFWFILCFLGDFICCCIIMGPLMSSMVELRETATLDGKAQTNLMKLRFFRNFYVALLVYFGFTKYLTFYIGSIFDYDLKWVNFFVIEAASLGFYIAIYYMVRPVEVNQYLAIGDEDEEEKALATIHREFSEL